MIEAKLQELADNLAKAFDVKFSKISEYPNTLKTLGWCSNSKEIQIRLKVYRRNQYLADSTVVRTLCHELAHLVHFDHSKHHRRLERLMVSWAKLNGFL